MPINPKRQTPPKAQAPPTTTPTKTVKMKADGGLSVFDRVKPIGFDENDGIKMSLYGRSGTGKTTLWATFPKPILAVIISGGKKPGELRSIDTEENRGQIDSFVVEKSDDIRLIVEGLKGEPGRYATVVLDHATGLQDLVLKEILGLEELPIQKTFGFATQQTWGQCGIQTKEYLRALLDLTSNVVIIAQERNFNEEANSELLTPTVGAALSPSVAGWLNAAVDYIGQTFIRQKSEETSTKIGDKVIKTKTPKKGVDYCLRSGPHEVFTTKFRVPKGFAMPEIIVNPDFEKIRSIITGTYKDPV